MIWRGQGRGGDWLPVLECCEMLLCRSSASTAASASLACAGRPHQQSAGLELLREARPPSLASLTSAPCWVAAVWQAHGLTAVLLRGGPECEAGGCAAPLNIPYLFSPLAFLLAHLLVAPSAVLLPPSTAALLLGRGGGMSFLLPLFNMEHYRQGH